MAVLSGMLGVTIFGLFLTPLFYDTIRGFGGPAKPAATSDQNAATAPKLEQEEAVKRLTDERSPE